MVPVIRRLEYFFTRHIDGATDGDFASGSLAATARRLPLTST